jgi:asparagine synthetase B (glutamine-hydrolysing)
MGQKTRNAIRKNKDQELARISMASRMHLRGPDADGIYTKDDDV